MKLSYNNTSYTILTYQEENAEGYRWFAGINAVNGNWNMETELKMTNNGDEPISNFSSKKKIEDFIWNAAQNKTLTITPTNE